MKPLGKMTVTEGLACLKEISEHYSLRLHVARELKLACHIFIARHSNHYF